MGEDKARLVVSAGQPVIRSVVEVVGKVCSEVLLVTDRLGRYEDLNLPAREVIDIVPGKGPLGGLHAGLRASESPFALVVGCDMPFLNPRLLWHMAERKRDYEALAPRVKGRWQPLHAIYARACLATLEEMLAQGQLSMTALLSRARVKAVSAAAVRRLDPQGRSFLNLNRPEELAQMRALSEEAP